MGILELSVGVADVWAGEWFVAGSLGRQVSTQPNHQAASATTSPQIM